ncbi:MAG: FAD-dependent oxidoreductase [Cyanobacteria bacterium J06639_18]
MVTNNNSPELQQTLIVGGGPAGFATALMLAKRGWKNITVLEKRPDACISCFGFWNQEFNNLILC